MAVQAEHMATQAFRLGASIEATPRQILDAGGLDGLFPKNTRVYLSDVGGPFGEFAIAARRLSENGYRAVPHFAARRLASRTEFIQRLEVLTGEAGVDDVLVIAGQPGESAGPYESSLDLLRTGLFDAHRIGHIAVAGHPEGNAGVSPAALSAALAEKNAIARDSDARFRIVTQFSFDPQTVIAWAETAVAEGNALPVHVGVAGPATITTLMKYAAICGVGASMGFLRKRSGALVTLATNHSPESFVGPLEGHVAENRSGPIRQIHIFPFGGLRRSAEWLAERGSWFAGESDSDLEVIG